MTGIAVGLSQLPSQGWSAGFSFLLREGLNPSGEFSLLKLENLLKDYQFPFIEKFDPENLDLHYKLYNTYGDRSLQVGTMRMNSSLADRQMRFTINIDRSANSGIMNKNVNCQYNVAEQFFARMIKH